MPEAFCENLWLKMAGILEALEVYRKGTILGAGDGAWGVDLLGMVFSAFNHCLPCCTPN